MIGKRELEREQRLRQVATEMTRTVPGVYGRVCDLAKPTMRKYRVAMNVALGGYADAILTDSSQTCRKCVQFLKHKKIEPMTFIPLRPGDLRGGSTMDARVVSQLQGEATPALDLLKFDRRTFALAFDFLLAKTLVVDCLDKARKVAYTDLPRLCGPNHGIRVVTFDGEMIRANGNMVVNCDAAAEGGSKFDIQDIQRSAEKLDQAELKYQKVIADELRGRPEVSRLENELRRFTTKKTDVSLKKQRVGERLKKLVLDVEKLKEVWKKAQKKCANLKKKLGELGELQKKLETESAKLTREHFAGLSAKVGVEDIRAVDLDLKRKREQGRVEESSVRTQVGELYLGEVGVGARNLETIFGF